MITTIEAPAARCASCGEVHPDAEAHTEACDALRAAGEAGARPKGVPVRVQAAYVEARQALRGDAPAVAVRVLQWLLGHLAETRGVSPDLSLSAKLVALSNAGVVSMPIRHELLLPERSATAGPEAAWALMTLAEHALARAYLRQGDG